MTKKLEGDPARRVLNELVRTANAAADGTKEKRREALARLVWAFVLYGHVTLPDGTELKAQERTWIAVVRWLYTSISKLPLPAAGELRGVMRMEWVDPPDTEDQDVMRAENHEAKIAAESGDDGLD